jgi:hypothetical protein
MFSVLFQHGSMQRLIRRRSTKRRLLSNAIIFFKIFRPNGVVKTTLYCPKCGASNQDDATFCSSCGNSLTTATLGSVPPPRSVERKSPIIVAILNFFLFGIGYLYLGYRRVLGFPTILFVVLVLIVYFIIGIFTFGLLELVIGIVLAYDGYVKAKGERGYFGTDPEYLYGKPTR